MLELLRRFKQEIITLVLLIVAGFLLFYVFTNGSQTGVSSGETPEDSQQLVTEYVKTESNFERVTVLNTRLKHDYVHFQALAEKPPYVFVLKGRVHWTDRPAVGRSFYEIRGLTRLNSTDSTTYEQH